MDETEFWELVDRAREEADGDPESQSDLLVEWLTGLDPDAVLDFARHFEARLARGFTWDLWGAAGVLLGGVDEDAFDAFRCWLVGQGRDVFEGALHDTDGLAELLADFDPEADGDCEDLGYVADEAYERLTGAPLPDLDLPGRPLEPLGTPLDPADETALAERFPRLWARFRA
ncbi:DUF4240 domain-containing protein [Streptomyces sp. B1866]|uniref:DUF4240 domain-containing protein n=1 Tax=Streptomyces sp. B1866 TaxID=3075431 RepID=UPI00288E951D|nr:DUF4240 domain-containing protein [Streptomyces sp. B1866]MDT3396511.1 DUF4240 domain-containing protein [Streptomyces sp. B1866]